jgi:two-component system NtrC family sensor kinase
MSDRFVAPRVECYCDELNQVFLNLIVNATHAIRDAPTQRTRLRGKLIIRTRKIDQDVQIEIQDNGSGIPLDARDRVFDPFFTTKQVGEGTGQGLTICHEIVVQKHHGTIWFDTEVDKGTTFFVRIPIQFDSNTGDSK